MSLPIPLIFKGVVTCKMADHILKERLGLIKDNCMKKMGDSIAKLKSDLGSRGMKELSLRKYPEFFAEEIPKCVDELFMEVKHHYELRKPPTIEEKMVNLKKIINDITGEWISFAVKKYMSCVNVLGMGELFKDVDNSSQIARVVGQKINIGLSDMAALQSNMKPAQLVTISDTNHIAIPDSQASLESPQISQEPSREIDFKQFPTPPNTRWEDIAIRFIDGHTVNISIGKHGIKNKKYNFAEMGFKNERNGNPLLPWKMLEILADNKGRIEWSYKTSCSLDKQKKFRLSDKLREFFVIPGDPFFPYKQKKAWVTRFLISTADDS